MPLGEEGPQEGAAEVPAALDQEARVKGEKVTLVSCEQHGPMSYSPQADSWACTGWAGEGCLTAMTVTGQQAASGREIPGATVEWSAA